jgi:hypothetical protein
MEGFQLLQDAFGEQLWLIAQNGLAVVKSSLLEMAIQPEFG